MTFQYKSEKAKHTLFSGALTLISFMTLASWVTGLEHFPSVAKGLIPHCLAAILLSCGLRAIIQKGGWLVTAAIGLIVGFGVGVLIILKAVANI